MNERHYTYQVEVIVKTDAQGRATVVKASGALHKPNLYRRGHTSIMGGAVEGTGVLRISPVDGLTFTATTHVPNDLERKLAAHNLKKDIHNNEHPETFS
jgi:hypothetical protein